MGSVHLESWVKQQYKEIGFGENGTGPFIGKAALKQRLISRYPMHKVKIRQLVNAYANFFAHCRVLSLFFHLALNIKTNHEGLF